MSAPTTRRMDPLVEFAGTPYWFQLTDVVKRAITGTESDVIADLTVVFTFKDEDGETVGDVETVTSPVAVGQNDYACLVALPETPGFYEVEVEATIDGYTTSWVGAIQIVALNPT